MKKKIITPRKAILQITGTKPNGPGRAGKKRKSPVNEFNKLTGISIYTLHAWMRNEGFNRNSKTAKVLLWVLLVLKKEGLLGVLAANVGKVPEISTDEDVEVNTDESQ